MNKSKVQEYIDWFYDRTKLLIFGPSGALALWAIYFHSIYKDQTLEAMSSDHWRMHMKIYMVYLTLEILVLAILFMIGIQKKNVDTVKLQAIINAQQVGVVVYFISIFIIRLIFAQMYS